MREGVDVDPGVVAGLGGFGLFLRELVLDDPGGLVVRAAFQLRKVTDVTSGPR